MEMTPKNDAVKKNYAEWKQTDITSTFYKSTFNAANSRWKSEPTKTGRLLLSLWLLISLGQQLWSTGVPLELGWFYFWALLFHACSNVYHCIDIWHLPRFRGVILKDGLLFPPADGGWGASPLYIAVNPAADEVQV